MAQLFQYKGQWYNIDQLRKMREQSKPEKKDESENDDKEEYATNKKRKENKKGI